MILFLFLGDNRVIANYYCKIQTKFTPPNGQDLTNMPYDPQLPLEEQVHTSIASSLQNLRPRADPSSATETYIDCLLLHSPMRSFSDTLKVWRVMESYVPNQLRALGISNVDYETLQSLYEQSTVKPLAVQNRFYADTHYDAPIREFCKEKGIIFESFWTLTGNPRLLRSEVVESLSQLVGVSRQVALYALVLDLGVAPLNGTTNTERMKSDLVDVMKVAEWAQEGGGKEWGEVTKRFQRLLN
jgi:diketogulonate reductase-like aldo/keto reductase